jgi:hypothetical protein
MDMTVNGMKVSKKSGAKDWKTYKSKADDYKRAVDSFLDTLKKSEYKKIKPYFQNYITFREKYDSTENDYEQQYPSDLAFLRPLVQYKKFDRERIVFWELNNTWYSIPESKDMENIPSRDEMRFGSSIINKFQKRIKELKSEGYVIVTLFHCPFRMIVGEEYQKYHNQPCIYDTLLELSDICLAGHEHGSESKDPDFLANSCQYFYNGAFYSEKTKNDIRDSSSLLIKIDRLNNTLTRKKLIFQNNKFIVKPSEEESYSEPIFHIYPDYLSKEVLERMDEKTANSDFYYRVLPYKFKDSDCELLYRKIIFTIFGKDFDFDWESNVLKKNNDKVALLYFVEIKKSAVMPKIYFDERKIIVCYWARIDMPRKQVENIVKQMNMPYIDHVMNGRLITFSFFLL